MNADDDGFCDHFPLMRMTENKPDDLKILCAKGFVHVFDENVLVILQWQENNYLRADRYTPSKYLQIYKDEINSLIGCQPLGIPVVCIGKDSIGKDRIGKDSKEEPKKVKETILPEKGTDYKKTFHDIKEIFEKGSKLLSPTNDPYYHDGKEATSIKRLEKRYIENQKYFEDLTRKYFKMIKDSNDKFWNNQVFSPSGFNCHYDRIKAYNVTGTDMDDFMNELDAIK